MWRGAAIAVAIATAWLVAWSTADQSAGFHVAAMRLVATDVAVAVGVAGVLTGVVTLALRRWVRVPWPYLWVALTSLVLLAASGAGASRRGWWVTIVVVLVGTTLLGAGVGAVIDDGRDGRDGRRPLAALVAGVLVLAVPGAWLATAGGPPPVPSVEAVPTLEQLTAAGAFDVAVTDYGSGSDPRPRYGTEADVPTEPVDASGLVEGWSPARQARWGFGPTRLPLNARVWHPAGAGAFPLVLIAHGNLSTAEDSELGFDYLAEHLASHGFVVAAVDHNFLNSTLTDRTGGLTGAMEARSWLLLEHLRAWQDWAQEPSHPLGRRVDLERVALIGHSRGGEAVAAAAYLAQQDHVPGHDEVAVPDVPAIGAVVALAPTEGQYRLDEGAIVLDDLDYLVLQGSHDADVGRFVGLEQYERVRLPAGSDHVKGAVYVARANHTQFNRGWGRHDLGNGLPKYFLDTESLLDGDQQRAVAIAWTSALLRHTFDGDDTLRQLLTEPTAAEQALPTPDLVSRYAHGRIAWLTTGRVSPADEVAVEVGDTAVGADASLVVEAVATSEDAWREQATVRLTDGSGERAEAPLTPDAALQGLVSGRYLKAAWLHDRDPTEPVLQTYTVPIADLRAANPALDPGDLRDVTVRLGQAGADGALLGNVGVLRPASDAP